MDKKRDEIQNNAVAVWMDNNKNGTLELHTGTGKTFCVFKILQLCPEITNVLFLAETQLREKNVLADIEEFKIHHNIDVTKQAKFKFACYQGAHKYKITDYFSNASPQNTLIVYDEIHEILTEVYSNFVFNNQLDKLPYPQLGLTATIDRSTKYIIRGVEQTKYDLLQTFCPSIYKYSLTDSIANGTSRQDLRFFVLKHKLDTTQNFQAGNKTKQFTTSEFANYQYLHKEFQKSIFISLKDPNRDFKIRRTAANRAKFLYQLPSKAIAIHRILKHLNGKTLVFGKDNPTLMKICPNAIVSNNKYFKQDLEDFMRGKTKVTASNKMLKQGQNIPLLDNVILHSYYGKEGEFVQMCGK